MEPNANPNAPAPPNVGMQLVEFIRTQRQSAAMAFGILAVVFLALTVFLGLKGYRAPSTPEKPIDKQLPDTFKDKDSLDPAKPPEEASAQRRDDYLIGGLAALTAFLAAGGVAAWLKVSPVPADEAKQRSEARIAILALGAALGALAIVAGVAFFYLWRESLTGWLDKGQTKDAKWVLTPILMIVLGAGLIFFAIQPARAEERNNSSLRRVVYWTNFGLTTLLLLVAFVVANVLFSLKVPNKLDTTATGFYSLSNNTRNLFSRLNEPITAYAVKIDGQDRMTNDIRQLLLACQDASEGKFTVKFLSEVANRQELISLVQKYPQLDLVLNQRGGFGEDEDSGAVLLTTGEDEKRHAVIPSSEFATVEGRQLMFQGEARLFKEVAFLADSQNKQVVYFTQGNQELDIVASGTDVSPLRSAGRLKAYLEKNYLDVRPLHFAPDKPSVPEDAAIVVIADPLTALPESAVGALRAYMNHPAKKGKLVALFGAHAGPDRKLIKTGLEGFMAELNIQVGSRFIYNLPNQYVPRPDQLFATFSRAAEQNPILQSIVKVSPFLRFGNPREIDAITTNPAFQATPLMYSAAEMRTWTEEEQIQDLRPVIEPMLGSIEAQRKRGVSGIPRPLAVTVVERGTARAAAFGNSYFVSDEVSRQSRGGTAPLSYDLFGVTIDWLRDKPSIAAAGVDSKKYSEYRFPQPAAIDTMRILFLPLGLALLCVVGLGAGVWVIRRR